MCNKNVTNGINSGVKSTSFNIVTTCKIIIVTTFTFFTEIFHSLSNVHSDLKLCSWKWKKKKTLLDFHYLHSKTQWLDSNPTWRNTRISYKLNYWSLIYISSNTQNVIWKTMHLYSIHVHNMALFIDKFISIIRYKIFQRTKKLLSFLNFLDITLQCVLKMFEACQFLYHIIIQFQYLLCLSILNAFIFFHSPIVWNRISLFAFSKFDSFLKIYV